MEQSRIEKLITMLQKSPDDLFLNHALALEYVKVGDEAEAKKRFQKNLENDPSYIATYYHLGKLLERLGNENDAVSMYEKGMAECKEAGDTHTYSELRSAHEELTF